MYAEADGLFDRLGVDLDPRRPARGLSIADQQIIEIAKAISLDARLLIMDEPTAALSGVEVERLFAVARSLRDEGRALVFISHRFDEVFALCDTVTVMRDGSYVATAPHRGHPVAGDRRARWSVARSPTCSPRRRPRSASPSSRSRASRRAGVFHDVSFTVRRGEIVGLAGLVGAGRSEIARAVFGVDGYDAGRVRIERQASPDDAARAPRSRPAWPSCPRTAAPRAWSPRRPSPATSPRSSGAAWPGPGSSPTGAENRAAGPWAGRLEVKTNALDMSARHDERRQPAEGRHRQVARHRARPADHRRADPRHRRRHQGRGAPAAVRARRPGHGDPDDLLRAARGARHGRPRPGRLRGPDHRRPPARRGHPRGRHARRHPPAGGRRDDPPHRDHARRTAPRPPRARSSSSSRAPCRRRDASLSTVLPLPRAVDLPGARRGHGRRHGQERELPLQRRRLAQLPGQPVAPAAARGRARRS